MDIKEEYHDPDYPGTSEIVPEVSQNTSEDGKIEKIKNIIRNEFANELEARESEIMLIDQRLSTSRKLLHRLRYTLVNNYYAEQKLHLTNSHIQDEVAAQSDPKTRNEVSTILRDGQKRLHPSVRKLLGKKTVDIEEIFKSREPRQRSRKDYSAMIKTRNYTIPADSTTSLRPPRTPPPAPAPAPPTKLPRHIQPKAQNVVVVDDVTRNKTKHRYRIVIGNTSKYSPASSAADRSTHQWLVYVRGAGAAALSAVTVRLHHSYQPHHIVHLRKPPYQVSRRGWGEFPARVELHFQLPDRNRPATVEHTIKLDRHYTGLQTLGAETIVDVWLYSTPEMLQYQYKEEDDQQLQKIETLQPKVEPQDEMTNNERVTECTENDVIQQNDSWLDFFSKDTTELDVDEMIIKPIKKEKTDNNIDNEILNKEIKQEIDTDFDKTSFNFDETRIKMEPEWNKYGLENPTEQMPTEILSSTSPKKKIMKYMDPTTGKIYYLEMDRDLDLSKVQEIVINSKGNAKSAKISPVKSNTNGLKNIRKPKKGVSLLKPEVKNLLKNESSIKSETPKLPVISAIYSHLENDHCYLGPNWLSKNKDSSWNNEVPKERQSVQSESSATNNIVKKEVSLYENLVAVMPRLTNSRTAVSYLLKKIPLISDQARDPDFAKNFPFVVESDEKYWKLDFAKRRNIEWSRAKLINKLLHNHLENSEIWRTKQILVYSRFHGYYPLRPEAIQLSTNINNEWTYWDTEKDSKQELKNLQNFSTLSIFDKDKFTKDLSDTVDLCESDEEIEIVNDPVTRIKKEIKEEGKELEVMPVSNEDERLRYMYVERKCADIGIELRNEDVGSGYSYSAVHAVLLSAVRSHAENMIRSSLASKLMSDCGAASTWVGSSSSLAVISLQHAAHAHTHTHNADLAAAHAHTHTHDAL